MHKIHEIDLNEFKNIYKFKLKNSRAIPPIWFMCLQGMKRNISPPPGYIHIIPDGTYACEINWTKNAWLKMQRGKRAKGPRGIGANGQRVLGPWLGRRAPKGFTINPIGAVSDADKSTPINIKCPSRPDLSRNARTPYWPQTPMQELAAPKSRNHPPYLK